MRPKQAIEYLKKMPQGEPVFVLRGQDRLAPGAIEVWVAMVNEAAPECPIEKTDEALGVASKMRGWAPRKFPD